MSNELKTGVVSGDHNDDNQQSAVTFANVIESSSIRTDKLTENIINNTNGQQRIINDDDDCDYIVVTDHDDETGTKLELPSEIDGSLTIATLTHSFPDAIGLKYRNTNTGIYRALGVDAAGKRILPPKGGWKNKTFVAIMRSKDVNNRESIKRRLDEPTKRDMNDMGMMKYGRNDLVDDRSSIGVVRKTCDLVVLNLPFKTTNDTLKTYFETFGEVVVAEIKTDYRSGQPKGFGFVQMRDIESQTKILDQYEHYIDGRMTQVKIPNSRNDRSSDKQPQQSRGSTSQQYRDSRSSHDTTSSNTKMYVGRVPINFSQDDIRLFFDQEAKKYAPHAQVEHVLIPKPHRGFAFVTFNDAEVTRKLIRIGDFVINTVSVCVSAASPKDSIGQQQQQQPPPMPPSSMQHNQTSMSGGGYGYGGYRGGGSLSNQRDVSPYPPSRINDDHSWNNNSWNATGGHHSRDGYIGSGGYNSTSQQSRQPPMMPTVGNNMNDSNLQAAWSAFWTTLQNQPNNGPSSNMPWQQQWPIGGGDNLSGGGIQQQQSTDVGGGTNVQQWPSNKS